MQIALEKVNKVASKLFGKGWGEDAQEPWLAGEWGEKGAQWEAVGKHLPS